MVLEKLTNVRSHLGGRLEDTRSGISRRNRIGIANIESLSRPAMHPILLFFRTSVSRCFIVELLLLSGSICGVELKAYPAIVLPAAPSGLHRLSSSPRSASST